MFLYVRGSDNNTLGFVWYTGLLVLTDQCLETSQFKES